MFLLRIFRIWTAGKFGRSYRHRRFYVVRLRNLSFRLFRVGDGRAFGKIVTGVRFTRVGKPTLHFLVPNMPP